MAFQIHVSLILQVHIFVPEQSPTGGSELHVLLTSDSSPFRQNHSFEFKSLFDSLAIHNHLQGAPMFSLGWCCYKHIKSSSNLFIVNQPCHRFRGSWLSRTISTYSL